MCAPGRLIFARFFAYMREWQQRVVPQNKREHCACARRPLHLSRFLRLRANCSAAVDIQHGAVHPRVGDEEEERRADVL